MEEHEIFAALAAPLDPQSVKTLEKRDKKSGRVTAIRYIDARTVIDRLNSICPGLWTFETELLAVPQGAGDKWVFKGRLTVCGAWQEDVGMNDNEDYYDPPKAAVSDALKRCAVHFGIGGELYGDAPKNAKQAPQKPPQAQPTSNQPAQHWIKDAKSRAAFWRWTHDDMQLTNEEVHATLKVEKVEQYTGTKEQAMAAIKEYAAKKAEAMQAVAEQTTLDEHFGARDQRSEAYRQQVGA